MSLDVCGKKEKKKKAMFTMYPYYSFIDQNLLSKSPVK